jgi:hypothetical protein
LHHLLVKANLRLLGVVRVSFKTTLLTNSSRN